MIRNLSLPLAAACLLTLTAGAVGDACSTLSVTSTTSGDVTTWTIDLDGSLPETIAWAAIGDTAGATTYDLGPLGSVTFGLASPFALVLLGLTDAAGDVSVSFDVPAGDPIGIDVFLQGAAFEIGFDLGTTPPTFGLTSCLSNVAAASF